MRSALKCVVDSPDPWVPGAIRGYKGLSHILEQENATINSQECNSS